MGFFIFFFLIRSRQNVDNSALLFASFKLYLRCKTTFYIREDFDQFFGLFTYSCAGTDIPTSMSRHPHGYPKCSFATRSGVRFCFIK
jgi:hypothetical protein